jgi:hypothetical protein
MVYIYGLYVLTENNEKEIRYVGKTIHPTKRLKEHIKEAQKKNNTQKHFWINKQLINGNEIKMCIIEECNGDNWDEREKYWISKFPNLTNISLGGEGGKVYSYDISYNDSKTLLKSLNIKSKSDFEKKAKDGLIPIEIPRNPREHYKSTGEWISYGDFFSSGYICDNFIALTYKTYDESCEVVKNLNIKNRTEWKIFVRQKLIPDTIPNRPERYYKNRGWVSWSKFLSSKHCISNKEIHDNFLSYDEAHKIVLTLNIKSENDWKKRYKSEIEQYNIPKSPNTSYDNFPSWGEFLGTNRKQDNLLALNYLSYEDAIEYIKNNMNIKSPNEWKKLVDDKKIPDCLPNNPQMFYKKRKIKFSWGKFLSTGKLQNSELSKQYLSYEDACNYIQQFNIKNHIDYIRLARLNTFPTTIPITPDAHYKSIGVEFSWGEYLGNGNISTSKKSQLYYSYEDASKYIQENFIIKDSIEYNKLIEMKKIPPFIPERPSTKYKNNGWINWSMYLHGDSKYLSYEDAKNYIQKNYKITSIEEYKNISNSNVFPKNIPKCPNHIYKKDNTWTNWYSFLGYCNPNDLFLSYNDAKTYVQKNYNFKSAKEYTKYTKSDSYKKFLPKKPDTYYKSKGEWKSWSIFLGVEIIRCKCKPFVSYDECKEFIQTNYEIKTYRKFLELAKNNIFPKFIPKNPNNYYKRKGTWVNFYDFFGITK